MNKLLDVKYVYNNYVFLYDNKDDRLMGNWIEPAWNCHLVQAKPPKIIARFLDQETKAMQRRKPGYTPKYVRDIENDEFGVGKSYKIRTGIYSGVRGTIVSTFKDYIEVRVFLDKITRVERS